MKMPYWNSRCTVNYLLVKVRHETEEWRTPLIPAFGRQRQLSLYREFLDSQSYKVRPCLKVKVVRYGTVRMYVRMYDVCT